MHPGGAPEEDVELLERGNGICPERFSPGLFYFRRRRIKLTGKGDAEEIVFARRNDGEETSVGRNSEVAEGEVVENGARGWLEDGNFRIFRGNGQLGNIDPR